MAICPKCSSEIDYLLIKEERTYSANALLQIDPDNNGIVYAEKEPLFKIETEFNCPICLETIFKNPENNEIFLFLMGE